MLEVKGDLWTYQPKASSVVRVITTNGFVKNNGEAVMGRGCAREAAKLYPELPSLLGVWLNTRGNKVCKFTMPDGDLVSFPVKHHWYQDADPAIIEQSCQELVALAGMYPHTVVFVIPRPGCGNGKLKWEDVKPILERYFDERFHVITW